MIKYNNLKIYTILIFITALFFSGCTKEVPKEMLSTNKQQMPPGDQNKQMPNDSIHRNLKPQSNDGTDMGSQTDMSKNEGTDTKAEELTKAADDADAKYQKSKSDSDKKACIEKQMAAANYLMFQADLTPKKKYRPALRRYRRVLELDPSNTEAAANKKQIEDIYQQMGMPVPE